MAAVEMRQQVLDGIRSGLMVDTRQKLQTEEIKPPVGIDKITASIWYEIKKNPNTSVVVDNLNITESDIRDIVKSVAEELKLL